MRKICFALESLGCAKNQVGAELIISALEAEGWIYANTGNASVIIVNSCAFIKSAKQESINTVISLKKSYKSARIVLAGCLALRYKKELEEALGEADLIIASFDAKQIARVLKENAVKWGLAEDMAGAADDTRGGRGAYERRILLSPPGSAYIKIAEGCNNFCSFCAIPRIRGPLVSRSIADIKTEFISLLTRPADAERGVFPVREFSLVAQDSASYGADIAGRPMLPELLETLSEIPGDFFVRLLYLHPDHFPEKILDVIKNDSRILPYFDIPFQHSSRPLLRLMNRAGSGLIYLNLLDDIRRVLPRAVIRSTFLAGFPSETEDDFDDLLDFQQAARIDWLGVFTYSREEGTEAFLLKERVSKKIAEARKSFLEEKQIPITGKRLDSFTGETLKVLVEEKIDEGIYLGRSFLNASEVDGCIVVHSPRALELGAFTRARITGRAGFDLLGICDLPSLE